MSRPVVVCLLAVLVIAASAQAVPVNLSLEPATTSGVAVGDNVRLDIWARSSTAGQDVTLVQAFITYDKTLLQVVDELCQPITTPPPAPGEKPVEHTGWDMELANKFAVDGGGEIYLSAGQLSSARKTDFVVGWLYFKAIAPLPSAGAHVDLVLGPVDRDPYLYETRVLNGSEDVTGDLYGATLYDHDGPDLKADANGPYEIQQHSTASVVLDGGGSTVRAGGTIKNYEWKILNPSAILLPLDSGPLPNFEVTYPFLVSLGCGGDGSYPLSLTITDDLGNTDTDWTTLVVTPEPLTLSLLGCGVVAIVARRRRR